MRPFPQVLRSLHKNIQRLSSFAFLVGEAPRSRPTTARALSRLYSARLQKRVSVPGDQLDRVLSYLSERGLLDRYLEGVRGASNIRTELASGRSLLEIQDWWLSDPAIRSTTGRERDSSFVKTVTAGSELQFLSDPTLTLDSYGHVLSEIAQERGLYVAGVDDRNPMADLPFAAAVFLQVLRCDKAMQASLLAALPRGIFSFRDHVIAASGEILLSLSKKVPSSAANRDVTSWIRKQQANANLLADRHSGVNPVRRGPATPTLLRPFEDLFLPRLEFLVDLQILGKPDPNKYVYRSTDAVSRLAEITDHGIDAISQGYYSFLLAALGRPSVQLEGPDDVLRHLAPAYDRLKGLTGFALIADCTVLANTLAWEGSPQSFVEISDALAVLDKLTRETPPKVRVISDRRRQPNEFTILERK